MIHPESIHELTNGDRALDQCRSYVIAQLQDREKTHLAGHPPRPGPAITVSFETGSGEYEFVRALADRLQQDEPPGSHRWTVFDRRLMEIILEEHDLPKELAKYIPEDRRSYLQDTTEELLGLRPPSWKIVPKTVETILHLVEMGHAIIVGRGASVITARTANVFHVRLVAPMATRVEYVRRNHGLTLKEATAFVLVRERDSRRTNPGREGKEELRFFTCLLPPRSSKGRCDDDPPLGLSGSVVFVLAGAGRRERGDTPTTGRVVGFRRAQLALAFGRSAGRRAT